MAGRLRFIPSRATQIALAMFPAGFGLAFFNAFDLSSLAREIEAAIAVVAALAVHAVTLWSTRAILRAESSAEELLLNAGADLSGEALRAADDVAKARERLSAMTKAVSGRAEELRNAVASFESQLEPLLAEILVNDGARRRARTFLGRTLPRLEDALATYVRYAERGTDMVDPTELRRRVIAAFSQAGQQANAIRMASLEDHEGDVQVALEVVEDSFAFNRR